MYQKYIEEFHKLDIRVDHDEEMEENIARYMGGLMFNIQDKLSFSTPRLVDEKQSNSRGGSSMRGRGGTKKSDF